MGARGDLDFLHRRVIVSKQRQELSSGIQVRRTKSRAGVRQITMPESIVPLLEAHLERHVAVGADAPLFAGPKGGVRRASFYKAWQKALKETGIRADLKPHDLRHLANTMAAKVPGSTLKDLMARLGHVSAGRTSLPASDSASRQRDGARNRRRAAAGDDIRRRRAG